MNIILESGGKQYWTKKGEILILPKLALDVGEKTKLKTIVTIEKDDFKSEENFVEVEILKHSKAKKVIIFKKKRRKGYERKQGFRAQQTHVLIL